MKPFLWLALGVISMGAVAHAQLPEDNLVWKGRCNRLAALDAQLQQGKVTPALVALTHGVAGVDFTTVAFNRSSAGDHYVACTMFYLASIAETAGNGGSPRPHPARNRAILGQEEYRKAHHRKTTVTEELKRAEVEAGQISAPTPTTGQVGKVIEAADTMPTASTPSSAPVP